jgi:hypothetical protein
MYKSTRHYTLTKGYPAMTVEQLTVEQLKRAVIAAYRMTDAEWSFMYGAPIEHGAALRENELDGIEARALAAGFSESEMSEIWSGYFIA